MQHHVAHRDRGPEGEEQRPGEPEPPAVAVHDRLDGESDGERQACDAQVVQQPPEQGLHLPAELSATEPDEEPRARTHIGDPWVGVGRSRICMASQGLRVWRGDARRGYAAASETVQGSRFLGGRAIDFPQEEQIAPHPITVLWTGRGHRASLPPHEIPQDHEGDRRAAPDRRRAAHPQSAAATGPSGPTPPAEFTTDWHDPVTAAPPVDTPGTPSCEVVLAAAQFRDFTPYQGSYTPPEECGTRWNKVVLRLEGRVKGRQYDRLGHVAVGGVEILRTSTPQPSPDGITWSVEKDVTRYRDVLARPQPVEMLIGNVVNETYTGVLDVRVTLTFHTARGRVKPAAGTPDRVLPLTGATLTTPRNTERLLAEVYATGSGGGCEEYWYLSVPDAAPPPAGRPADRTARSASPSTDASPASPPLPHGLDRRLVQPLPLVRHPGPRAFDVRPVVYDLTPFAGILNDGRPHRVEVTVAGVPAGQAGWSVPTNILLWQDEGSRVVTGASTGTRRPRPATPRCTRPVRRTPSTGSTPTPATGSPSPAT